MAELTDDVVVVNTLGMHARPAAALVQRVLPFQSDIYICFNDNRINAKSIMGLLTLGAARGSRMKVTCSGPDAVEAMTAVKELFAAGFNEE